MFKSCQGGFTETEVTSIALVRFEFEKPLYVSEKLNPDKNSNFSVSRLKECTWYKHQILVGRGQWSGSAL